ncbi:6-carboxytetrahydropterin synthase [Paraburkholderia strydomiana]|jgi:6-pyruvoyltetrahydropterin/6-carboxytetrahydropterin synthase|uniref:6-carboxy-5,6,7,8-tetrahydropterin synthase n=1 Tax=Paraburkholderia strydomiana TaxID=1245417 RepID=A0ABW9EPU2_9BURK
MKYQLSQSFYFDAAHTLEREIHTEISRRIHGHTYRASVTVSGAPNPVTKMIVDLGTLQQKIEDVRGLLDHRLLDDVPDLGSSTLENLCSFILTKLSDSLENVIQVSVERPHSGDRCTLSVE